MNGPLPADMLATGESHGLVSLLDRVLRCSESAECDFMAVNDTHLLAGYRQASLWIHGRGTVALSGIAAVERNAPYVQWLDRICADFDSVEPLRVGAETLDPEAAVQWAEWLAPYGLWIPFSLPSRAGELPAGGVLFSREDAWAEAEIRMISTWLGTWATARHSLEPLLPGRWTTVLPRKALLWLGMIGAIFAGMLIQVPLSVLAPAELVPVEPLPVRAPLDGVVRDFYVKPNQLVKSGDPLFSFDVMQLSSRLEVASQALVTAEVELRQLSQQALTDTKARSQLASARGNVAEKRAEADYLRGQRGRARVLAVEEGIVLLEDPQEWIGKPVVTGERILRIASDQRKEIEAWLAVGDAIALPPGSEARLYLSASPLDPIGARVRYVSHDAVRKPDGSYAYRVRAAIDAETDRRIGLRGTVRLTGERVSLGYWIFRRPIALCREFFGI